MAAMTSRNSSKSKNSRRRFTRPTFGLFLALALLGALTACKPTTPPTTTQNPPPTTASTTMPMDTSTTMPMGSGTIVPDQCKLAQLAFCDTFQTLNPGGRGGDLDESKWSFARVSQATNPSAGLINNYAAVNAEFCMSHMTVIADNDSFICGEQFGESNHWMEAMNDNDQYVNQAARIVQPFDFAGRTGNMVFDVDAKTEGSHSAWPEIWLTDEPVQTPHDDHPGTRIFPKRGVEIVLNGDWCGPLNQTFNALRTIRVFNNYQVVSDNDYLFSPCFSTQGDHPNHFQIKVSPTRIEVWGSDKDRTNFRFLGAANVNLPFTRGYWSFQHSQYAANKFNDMQTTTYHWHSIGFDGPVLPVDRDYQVADARQPRSDGTLNLGYQTPTATFSLPNVNTAGATKAYLTYNVYWYPSPAQLSVNINGVNRTVGDPNPDVDAHRYQWRYVMQPVALSDLHAGTNTIQINNTGCADNCPTVANIDLELVLS